MTIATAGSYTTSWDTIRLGSLIRSLLSTQCAQNEAVDAHELLECAMAAAEPLARDRGVTLHFVQSAPARVRTEGDQAIAVLVALVENAIKHGRYGGTVNTRVLALDGACQIEVEDDGPGVAEADAERIFEYGVRASGADGFGIGLAGARTFAQSSGGDIHVLRSPLGGARFVVRLPLSSQSAAATEVRDSGRRALRESAGPVVRSRRS